MLKDLSTLDFDFYRGYADKMRSCHDREFMQELDPELIRCFYRGKKQKDNRFTRTGVEKDEKHTLLLNTVYAAANTILPNLYYQNAWPIVQALRDEATPESAALLAAALKHYMKVNNAKIENQEACLNGYFFGLGWKKLGYRVEYAPKPEIAEEPETKKPFSFTSLLRGDSEESETIQPRELSDVVEEEGLFNASESPLNVMLDHKSDLLNTKAILHKIPRTLYDLMNFGSYDEEALTSFYKKYKTIKGSRLDTRELDCDLFELHIKQRNGIWILTWIDGYDKPLQYEKSTWQGKGFQFEPLAFSNEPGQRYPISHMKIATQVQEKVDKMASMFYEKVARAQDLTLINKNDLEKGQLEAIVENRTRGIIVTNKPVNAGTFAHIQSPGVQNDLPLLMNMSIQNMIEVMGTDQQLVSGRSKNKTLGQDELARVGTKIRESGMQDRVRDWMIRQFEKEATLLQKFSDAELQLEIMPEDYSTSGMMDGNLEPKMVEFMTMNNPLGLKNYIPGQYDFDFSIDEATKPDSETIRLGVETILKAYGQTTMKQDLIQDRKRLKTGLLWEQWIKTFNVLGNPKKYLEEIDSMQLAAMQAQEIMMGGGGQSMMAPKPKESPDIAGKPESLNREPVSSEAATL